ncbi:LacI family DNA-binding transcriptional regulator [Nonomuraea angiospora]|uniref:LacI family DNA-binding transcriptional regulator n=1 Tax=Nonomuraea angiospora TaxID=46172 RepID=UPI0029AE5B10|nr:LacI family DNA-binding transcriptional regulator [Nonomuraea angiospora]MDX3105398.1 LacI family DNA-binding transcriptional regulator [Nonomuraea angiospora]
MKRPTLADVAVRAGVSAKTVSNVLLGRPHVSAATRAKVQAAVEEVGYEAGHATSQAGRGLASGRTGRIAVVVPNLYQPYFAENAERLILALAECGFTSTLRIANGGDRERDAVLGVTTADADGVIICPHHLSDELLAGAAPRRPAVALGGAPIKALDGVLMGEHAGFLAITRHLLATGRRRLAFVWNGPAGAVPTGDRYSGFAAALEEHGIEHDPSLVAYSSDWDRRASGYEAMVGLLRRSGPRFDGPQFDGPGFDGAGFDGPGFDGAVCVNDTIAVGVLKALRAHAIRVPEDVAVTGFDDTDEGEFTIPSLSSVSPDQGEMVAAAVRLLIERLDGYDGPARQVHTGVHLLIRDSSAQV